MTIYIAKILMFLEWLQSTGSSGIGVFMLLFIVGSLLFFPASMLAALAGFLFGPLTGTLATSLAGVISATIAFVIGHYLMKGRRLHWVQRSRHLAAINTAVSSNGFRIVFLLRLASILPFIPLSYVLGTSQIKLREYVVATWFGLLPGTFMYVYLGTLVTNITQFLDGEIPANPYGGALSLAGIALLIFTVSLIARTARKALNLSLSKDTPV